MSFSLLAIKAVLRACCNPCNFFLNKYTYIAAPNCYNSNLLMVKIPSFHLLSVSSYMQINCHGNNTFLINYQIIIMGKSVNLIVFRNIFYIFYMIGRVLVYIENDLLAVCNAKSSYILF